MQHERVRLLYLNDGKEPIVEDVFRNLAENFLFESLQNKEDLLNLFIQNKPAISLIDHKYLDSVREMIKDISDRLTLNQMLIIVLGNNVRTDASDSFIFDILRKPVQQQALTYSLKNAYSHIIMQQEINQLQSRLNLQTNELQELNRIGIALSAEREPDKLLELILRKIREITHSDAGSLYLVEVKENSKPDDENYFTNKQLRFKLAQNDSIPIELTEFVMPIERKSIAGYVALSGQILNIPDVYNLPSESEFGHNRSYDESIGYRAKSMLVIPMKTHKDEIIGVLQLINRKQAWNTKLTVVSKIDEQVIPFDNKCVDLASSLASQAAVSIENNRLYEEIKNLFDGFVHAAVHAIEQRDPTTFGHSERVATFTSELAKLVDSVDRGRFKDIKFSRNDIQSIHYAGLLHDFGKIGVRENILVKAKKLFPHELETVKYRYQLIKKGGELKYSKKKIAYLMNEARQEIFSNLGFLDSQIQEFHDRLDQYMQMIYKANEPTVLQERGYETLFQIANTIFEDNGTSERLLTSEELKRLSIPKGSLSEEERIEIESHVTHTFNFLKKIPWTSELKNIPQIAYAHHEKIDGSGYPRGLACDEIPIQAKMMAIADIYDALTAWDRPYKKAVPVDKALDILQWEVNSGKLDADLFNLFLEHKIYEFAKRSGKI